MNLYLVQASDKLGTNKFLPLAVAYQWCYGKNASWTLKDTLIEKISPKEYVLQLESPDMVAMSSYIWNWEYNKKLAKEIKKVYPKCVIVTGGPQINKHDKNFFVKHKYFDAVIHGEGEIAFKEILARPLRQYDNIPHVQTPTHIPRPAQRLKSVKNIPSPILEGFYEPIMAKYPKDTVWQVTWESLRGCPYHCAFCDIGEDYWNKLTLFDIDRCKKEITWMGKNKIEFVSVCDSNWGLLERDIELTKHVVKTKDEYGYPKVFDATWSKNNVERNYEIAMIGKDKNLFKGVTIALQTFNDKTLEAVKRFNYDIDRLKIYLDKYREQNIPTYSELIWPMPGETYTSLKTGIQKLIDMGQDNYLMIHPLVITDNATIGNKQYQKDNKITVKNITLDTVYLDADEDYIVEYTDAVFATGSACHETVIEGHMYSWLVILMYYYGWGHYLAKYMRKHNVKETELFDDLLQWIKKYPTTLLGNEYKITKKCFYDVYNNNALWGRKVYDNTLWEYKGASSIILHDYKDVLRDDLICFLNDTYDLENTEEIVELNLAVTKDSKSMYPYIMKKDKKIIKDMFDINTDTIAIDHTDKEKPGSDWYQKAYHYNRKVGYWKCTVSKA